MPIEYINPETCIGCGTCVETCPMDVFRLTTTAVAMNEISPCQAHCPLGVDQRVYIDLLNRGMLEEAAEALRQYHPGPAITGRLCPHPCETACSRNQIDEAVNINSLEQYTGDYLLNQDPVVPPKIYKAKVAVIGSGPAGLSAAYFLTLQGYEVSVFEKREKPGGIVRNSVPNFRFPEEILDKQIAIYEKMGIEFRTGITFGKDITRAELEKENYGAFIAATGASKPFTLPVPGADAQGITSAMEFLGEIKAGELKSLSGQVAVIGGGSVALDAARSALRLGADGVHVICLETLEAGTKDSILAPKDEIEDSLNEGINFHPSRSVTSFVTDKGRVKSIQCVECTSVRDEDGTFSPVYGDSILPQEIAADRVILAIGQGADPELIPSEFLPDKRGYIQADRQTGMVAQGLFAAGDAVTGPSTIVEAMASGKRAALAADCFLRGLDMVATLEAEPDVFKDGPHPEIGRIERTERRKLPAAACTDNFKERVLPFNMYEANLEAERCLTCGSKATIAYQEDCQICHLCRLYCPTGAITITSEKSAAPLVGL
jgi:NADPH-dependent glutamate synthase beta subunit-like oxidoreductase